MFLFAILLAVVAIVHFLAGILIQRVICDSIRHSDDSQVINLLDKVVKSQQSVGINVQLNWALNSCHQNQSIYKVLKLEDHFNLNDVTNYLDKFEINKTLTDLTHQINANTSIMILSPEAKRHLEDLVASGIADISYDKFTDELAHNLTSVDLGFLATKLDELVTIVQDKVPGISNLSSRLKLCALLLRTFQTNFVEPMTVKSRELIVSFNDTFF